MADAERHRGPDGGGVWSSDGVALGHRRLKIIDLSDAAAQPMRSSCGRYTMVFNGEVYNYRELREEVAATWRTQSDTEVVLEAFARWGAACLERFIGMWAFAVWDAHEHTLFCARDRFGIKPFHWAMRDGNFLFASEIEALLAAGVPAAPNPSAIHDFLARDLAEHNDETFFAGVMKLPPGSYMTVRAGEAPRPRPYWTLPDAVGEMAVPADSCERRRALLELLDASVRLNLRADVPIAVAVSAGLDSATLLALIERNHPEPNLISTVTFSFDETEYDERPWVELLLAGSKRPCRFVDILPSEFADAAAGLVQDQQEPFAGLPIYAYARCAQAIRRDGAIILLDGSGLDEGFAGYTRFLPAFWADLFAGGDLAGLDAELTAAGHADADRRLQALARMARAAGPDAGHGMGQDLTASVRADTITADLAASADPAPLFERPFAATLANQMYREMRYTKLPRALRFRDRLSMASGVELRPPFVDHRLFEFAFALPAGDLIRGGVQKAIVRDSVGDVLPAAVARAPKRQVQTPQREWFRGPLAGWVRDHIDRPSFWELGWVDRRRGRAAMEAFLAGDGDNSFFLWQWINLGLWMDAVVRRSRKAI
jgi:asparagine synthase (glutamine-hydrolysing)